MSSAISTGFSGISDLNLWFKLKEGSDLYLSDLQAIIKLRFPYIVENWQIIKGKLLDELSSYGDPFRLQKEVDSFSSLVATQLAGSSVIPSETSLLSKFYTIFDSILINDAPISKREQEILTAEQVRVLAFTKSKFLQMRIDFTAARDQIADSIGGNDADYNRIYSRASGAKTLNKSIDEIQSSAQFQTAIDSVDFILANEEILKKTAAIDPFALARVNANNPEFNISSYSSGKLIRMEYGETLQKLAARTLSNPDLWIDIAIANGLKPPYVDEVGTSVFLISNGSGNRINLSKTDSLGNFNRDKFYLNQIIMLQSNVERSPDQRIINSISEIPVSGELVIELSGDEDLAKYKTQDKAYLRVFAPQTINSTLFVLIPNKEVIPGNIKTSTPWFLRSKGEDERRAGVDLYVDEKGDLQFTPSGDIQLSYGAANGIQALLILLSTELGSLTRHQDYGISSNIGSKNIRATAIKQKMAESVSKQILNDSRFDRLKTLSVQSLDGASGYQVFVEVILAGGNSVIPITFTVNVS